MDVCGDGEEGKKRDMRECVGREGEGCGVMGEKGRRRM